jgi:hypothetical protein
VDIRSCLRHVYQPVMLATQSHSSYKDMWLMTFSGVSYACSLNLPHVLFRSPLIEHAMTLTTEILVVGPRAYVSTIVHEDLFKSEKSFFRRKRKVFS